MSAPAIFLIPLVAMAYCAALGFTLGVRHERRQAWRLTPFAAWVFSQIHTQPKHEWFEMSLQRRDGKYTAMVDHIRRKPDGSVGRHTTTSKGLLD